MKILMKFVVVTVLQIVAGAGAFAAENINLKAGHLSITLNDKGQITRLSDDRSKTPDFIPRLP